MNIFDETELNKRLAEEEAKFGLPQEELSEEPEEKPQEPDEEIEAESPIEEEEPEIVTPTNDDWKKQRLEKKALKEKAKAAEQAALEKEKQLSELRERLARMEGREEARVKPEIKEVDTDPEPDAYLDPDLHTKWQLRQVNKRLEAAERRAQMAEELAKVEGTRRGLDMVEKDYIRNNKIDDYDNAIEHIRTVERNLIKLEHPQATDDQINTYLDSEKIKKASECYAKGVNPGEYFYKMAQTLGYQKAVKTPSNKPNIESLNRNMPKNANLIGASNVDKTGALPTDKVVSMSIEQLLSKEGSAALDAAIRREEAKMLGL
jgi:hypothetical protein